MPGMISRLMRLFSLDVTIDPDSPQPVRAGPPFVGDEDDKALWDRFQEYMSVDTNRLALYNVYEQMDMTDLIGGILDMYAEDSTPVDPRTDRTIWMEAPDKEFASEGNLFLAEIGYEEDITALARDLAKFGDVFDRLVYTSGEGILATHCVHPRMVHRKEDKVHKLKGFMQDGKKYRRQQSNLSWPWDYVHYRLRGRNRDSIYGTSFLYNLVRPWRQLVMAEDYSLLYQISRHPDRNLFMIDVGTLDEAEAQRTVRRFREAAKYNMHRDPKHGGFDYRFSPITPLEDIFLGVRPNSNTRVEKLAGSSNANEALNLMYYINKLFATSRVPKSTFGYEGSDVYNPKQSITNQDIRYAKNAVRLQRALKHGVRTMLMVHFVIHNKSGLMEAVRNNKMGKIEEAFRRRSPFEFYVKMAPVSYLEELQRLELDQTRWQVTDQMLQSGRDHPAFDSRQWVYYLLKTYARLPQSVLDKVLVKLTKARDREGYWYGGTGEMPPAQKAAMQATSIAQGIQAQQSVEPQEQQEISPEDLSRMSDAELKKLGATPEEIAKIRKLSKEDVDRIDIDPERLSDEDRQCITEMVRRDPRIQKYIREAQEVFLLEEEDDQSYRAIPLPEEVTDLSDDVTESDLDFNTEPV